MFIKAVYAATFLTWATALFLVFSSGRSFGEQAPLCILSTMAIFGVSTLIVKWYEKRDGRK